MHKIKHACSKKLAEITKTVKGTLDISLTNFLQADTKLKEYQPNVKVADIKTDKKEANGKFETDFNKRDDSLASSEKILQDNLKNHKLDLQGKTKHALLLPCLAVIVLVLAISGSEAGYTASAFELTGLSFYERFMVAIGIGLSTIFVGVGVIEILRSNWNYVWKIVGAVSSFILILLVYFVIGKIRVALLEKEMASGVEFSDLSAFDFLLINLIFFVAIVLIHWLLWPTKDKFRENREYNNVQSQIDKTNKELKGLHQERSALPNKLLKEQTKVSVKHDKNIADIEAEFANLATKRAESQSIYNNVFGRLMELYDEINFFYKETVGLYIATMNKYRNDGVFVAMDETIEDLPNPFKGFNYLDDSPELKTPQNEYSDINLNFDELLTNTNTKQHENAQSNN